MKSDIGWLFCPTGPPKEKVLCCKDGGAFIELLLLAEVWFKFSAVEEGPNCGEEIFRGSPCGARNGLVGFKKLLCVEVYQGMPVYYAAWMLEGGS